VRDYEDFKRLVREHVEHLVALEALEDGADLLLIDGSLYGRMIHVIRELKVEGREDFMLEYAEAYSELLSSALENGAVVVGVSKDSRSTVLKEELLLTQLVSLLSGYEPGVRERVIRARLSCLKMRGALFRTRRSSLLSDWALASPLLLFSLLSEYPRESPTCFSARATKSWRESLRGPSRKRRSSRISVPVSNLC